MLCSEAMACNAWHKTTHNMPWQLTRVYLFILVSHATNIQFPDFAAECDVDAMYR